jgi:RNA polymerase sigma-70 factor (ECF subfamily)
VERLKMCEISTTEEEKRNEFGVLAIQHMNSFYNTALRMTGNEAEAEDLVQDAYLRAFRFFDKFEKGTNFKAWLFKIIRNIYINKYRNEINTPQMMDVSDAEAIGFLSERDTPEILIFDDLLDDDITKALDTLPDDFRLTLIMSDLEGFSYKEIADILDCPIGTVMSRLHRGRKLLRKNLYEYAKKNGYLKG